MLVKRPEIQWGKVEEQRGERRYTVKRENRVNKDWRLREREGMRSVSL